MSDELKPEVIGVHTLSEFVFCPRAGVISHEQQKDDRGVGDDFADLSYMPNYEMDAIGPKIRKLRNRIEKCLIGLFAGIIFTWATYMLLKPFLGFLCLLVLLPVGSIACYRMFQDWQTIQKLNEELAAYKTASEKLPDLDSPMSEILSWPSLLKSCDVERCHDMMIDEEIGIAGSPWKLLRRGQVCMPVFICKQPKPHTEPANNPLHSIYAQHFVRMRAYCHLIEKCTGARSLCGIVVFSGTFTAVALKFANSNDADRQFELALLSAQETLKEYAAQDDVNAPAKSLCKNCHLGNPRRYRHSGRTILKKGATKRARLNVIGEGKSRKSLHSTCGDFFDWIPPNERARELGIETS